ncbi:MGMT family protein [Longispora sp. NPDC051575]|uniref:MGMT family protein n=1 Tax=Longispora sp. NPDC051575 TaxID=3154943 RepID=UPI00342E3533
MDVVEAVLAVVETIPEGKVMSYGAIADYLGLGSARIVGQVMAVHGAPVAWHRVVAANGRLVPHHEQKQMQRLMAEGVLFRTDKVNMARYAWYPESGG